MKSDMIENSTHTEEPEKKTVSKKPIIISLVFVIICIFMAFPLIIFPNKTLGEFKTAFKEGNYEEASLLYYDVASEGNLRDRMNEYILKTTDSMFAEYKNGNKEFSELKTYMENTVDGFKLDGFAVYDAMLEELSISYEKYNEGISFEQSGQLGEAILRYSAVAENDPQYLNANEKISTLCEEYKKYLSEMFPVFKENKDYEAALKEIDFAREIFGETSYSAEREQFEGIKTEHEKQIAKDNQEVYTIDAYVSKKGNGKSDMLVAEVKNASDKKVKMYIVAFSAYDKDGKRVQLSSKRTSAELADYVRCQNKKASIAPDKTGGKSYGWAINDGISDKISILESCIISVEYDDGTKWDNPYYKYWCSDNGIVDNE